MKEGLCLIIHHSAFLVHRLLRRALRGLVQRGAVQVELVAAYDLDLYVRELLAQWLKEVLRVADDDDVRVRDAEARAGELLNLRRGHGLHVRDVVVYLAEVEPVERERGYLPDDAL